MYIFQRNGRRVCDFPLRDLQLEPPVDFCARCGGEIYPFDPVEWGAGPPICPACSPAEQRERKNEKQA